MARVHWFCTSDLAWRSRFILRALRHVHMCPAAKRILSAFAVECVGVVVVWSDGGGVVPQGSVLS